VNDESDDKSEDDERSPEDPDGLRNSAAGDVHGIGSMHPAEHDNGVAAHGDVLAEMRAAEEIDHVMTDGGIIFRADAAEEHDYIVPRLMLDAHVSEEDDHVVVDVALGVDTAEKADCVVDRVALGDVDVAPELHDVFVGARGNGSENERRDKQQGREQTLGYELSHVDPHAKLYARPGRLVP